MRRSLYVLLLALLLSPMRSQAQVELGANYGITSEGSDYALSASYRLLRHLKVGLGYDAPQLSTDDYVVDNKHVHCPYIFADYVKTARRHELYIGAAYNLFDLTVNDNSSNYWSPPTDYKYAGSGLCLHIGYSWRVWNNFWLNAEYGFHAASFQLTTSYPGIQGSASGNEAIDYSTFTLGVHYKLRVLKPQKGAK